MNLKELLVSDVHSVSAEPKLKGKVLGVYSVFSNNLAAQSDKHCQDRQALGGNLIYQFITLLFITEEAIRNSGLK